MTMSMLPSEATETSKLHSKLVLVLLVAQELALVTFQSYQKLGRTGGLLWSSRSRRSG